MSILLLDKLVLSRLPPRTSLGSFFFFLPKKLLKALNLDFFFPGSYKCKWDRVWWWKGTQERKWLSCWEWGVGSQKALAFAPVPLALFICFVLFLGTHQQSIWVSGESRSSGPSLWPPGSLYSCSTHPAFTCLSISTINTHLFPGPKKFIHTQQLLSQHKHLVPWSLEFLWSSWEAKLPHVTDTSGPLEIHVGAGIAQPVCCKDADPRNECRGLVWSWKMSSKKGFMRKGEGQELGRKGCWAKKHPVQKAWQHHQRILQGRVCVCMYVWVYYVHCSSIIADWFRLPTGLLPSANADNWKFGLLSLKTKQNKPKHGSSEECEFSMLFRLSLGFLEFLNKHMYLSPGSEEGEGRGVCAAFIREKEPALTVSHAVIYQLRCLIPIPNSLVSGSQQDCYKIGLVVWWKTPPESKKTLEYWAWFGSAID